MTQIIETLSASFLQNVVFLNLYKRQRVTIYDLEIVWKNMKYLKEFYDVTQKELGKVLKFTQHSIFQFETVSRGLNYELV